MTSLSAFIRLADSKIGCEPWPICQMENIRIDNNPGITITAADKNKGLRVIHRLMASGFGIVAILLMLLSIWYRRDISTSPILAFTCFVLTVLLAVVGMATPDLLHPIITFTNLTAGMMTIAVLWLLVLRLQTPALAHSHTDWHGLANIVLCIAVIGSGAWVSANFATSACQGLGNCGSISADGFVDALSPGRELQLIGDTVIPDGAANIIGLFHRAMTLLLMVSLALMTYQHFRAADSGFSHLTATTFVILFLLTAMVTTSILENGKPSLLSAWLHNFWSMLMLMAIVFRYFLTEEHQLSEEHQESRLKTELEKRNDNP